MRGVIHKRSRNCTPLQEPRAPTPNLVKTPLIAAKNLRRVAPRGARKLFLRIIPAHAKPQFCNLQPGSRRIPVLLFSLGRQQTGRVLFITLAKFLEADAPR